MPYIKPEDRQMFENSINQIIGVLNQSEGNLNYVISRLCWGFIQKHKKGLRYSVLNTIIGVLECAKLEFYRRIASPYEDKKIIENGDVYESE